MPADTIAIASSSDTSSGRAGARSSRFSGDATIKPRIMRQGYIRFRSLSDLDGRSRAAQTCRDLVRGFEADLGGVDQMTVAQHRLVMRAAMLETVLADFELRWAAGEVFELPDYLATVNAQRRVLITLGLERRAHDITPSLSLREQLAAEPRNVLPPMRPNEGAATSAPLGDGSPTGEATIAVFDTLPREARADDSDGEAAA
jgi:hypothetical protein